MKNKKIKIKQLLTKSKQEVRLYKKTHQFPHLSQACEKTWVAFILALEYKSGVEIRNGSGRRVIANRLDVNELFHIAEKLHIIHYEGSPAIQDSETFQDIENAHKQIKRLLV